MNLSVYQYYAHIFWVPIFPMGKTGATECGHCLQVVRSGNFASEVKTAYAQLLRGAKTPFWTFAGLALAVVGLVAALGLATVSDGENQKLIAAPQKGDVYEVKLDRKQYTLYQVAAVTPDSVYLLVHQMATNKIIGLADLKKQGPSGYDPEPVAFSKQAIAAMLASRQIFDLERAE
jgi:hypothetical protein